MPRRCWTRRSSRRRSRRSGRSAPGSTRTREEEGATAAPGTTLAAARHELRPIHDGYTYVEDRRGRAQASPSDLFGLARTLVRAADGAAQAEREAAARVHRRRAARAQAAALSHGADLRRARDRHPDLLAHQAARGAGRRRPVREEGARQESPAELAARLVKGPKLKDVKVRRKRSSTGGKAAVDASKDPMIELARLRRPRRARGPQAVRGRDRGRCRGENGELHRQGALRGSTGPAIYPDATFTLRLSLRHGRRAARRTGREVKPFTTFGGAFERATGPGPVRAAGELARRQGASSTSPRRSTSSPTNDIIGGNSGSPVIERRTPRWSG